MNTPFNAVPMFNDGDDDSDDEDGVDDDCVYRHLT